MKYEKLNTRARLQVRKQMRTYLKGIMDFQSDAKMIKLIQNKEWDPDKHFLFTKDLFGEIVALRREA